MTAMRGLTGALAAFVLLCPVELHSEPSDGTAPEVGAIQWGAEESHCTGLLVSHDIVVTSDRCVDFTAGKTLSFIPGLNSAAAGGPAEYMPRNREFITAGYHNEDQSLQILRIGLIEGRGALGFLDVPETRLESMAAGAKLDVIYYSGEQSDIQLKTTCELGSFDSGKGTLECMLPDTASGAPVFAGRDLIGVITELNSDRSVRFSSIDRSMVTDVGDAMSLSASPFGSVNILNRCDQDIHQGLFWLDADGETWKDAARRVPKGSRLFLPVETIGDVVFSYARSDDGSRVWQGQDLNVRMKGVNLPMMKLQMPQPTGDLTILYDCQD